MFCDSGTKNRNLIQLLHACFALQKFYEMCEFREIWRSANNMPYGDKFQEPVFELWECVALACSQFLERKEGFYNAALGVTKPEIKLPTK